MNYEVIVCPYPATEQEVQKLINKSVPSGKSLVSTSVYHDGNQLMILIVCR
jgi:hypothetical protein